MSKRFLYFALLFAVLGPVAIMTIGSAEVGLAWTYALAPIGQALIVVSNAPQRIASPGLYGFLCVVAANVAIHTSGAIVEAFDSGFAWGLWGLLGSLGFLLLTRLMALPQLSKRAVLVGTALGAVLGLADLDRSSGIAFYAGAIGWHTSIALTCYFGSRRPALDEPTLSVACSCQVILSISIPAVRLQHMNPITPTRTPAMIDTPEIAHSEARPSAVIRFTIPRSEIQQVMGPGFGELASTLAEQGVTPAGPFYSHHFRMDPEIFDFELGVPVSAPIQASGRVIPGELPAAKVARTVYRGGYEGLGEAWGKFGEWLKSEGHNTAPNLWETYVQGPESGPDASTYRTELNRPVTD